jgi:hypothetical protein
MMVRTRLEVLLFCIVAFVLFHAGGEIQAQSNILAGRIVTGTAYFISGVRSARPGNTTRQFTLNINQVTTSEQVNQLNSALQSGGQDELLRVLSSMNAGRIQIGTGVGVQANAIIASQEGDRTKITVLYRREMRFAELRYGARSTDYPFGYAEMYFGPGGNQGMLVNAARIRLRDGAWQIEDFGTYPARLMGLQLRGRGRNEIG